MTDRAGPAKSPTVPTSIAVGFASAVLFLGAVLWAGGTATPVLFVVTMTVFATVSVAHQRYYAVWPGGDGDD